MDLLKTILLYLTMVFVSSVQAAPEPSAVPATSTPAPTAIVATVKASSAATPTPTPVPTPAITPNSEYKTLQVGDKGDNVKLLQRRLAELGYYTGTVDGVFGNQTRRAVERFQYYQGLSTDGIAGKRTLTVLYESTEVVFAPVDVTPTPTAKPTTGPTAAITTPPATVTQAPTFVPAASPTPAVTVGTTLASTPALSDTPTNTETANADAAATQTPKPEETATAPAVTAEPDATSAPLLLTDQDFALAGSADPLVKISTAPISTAEPETTAEPVTLHPVQYGEEVYVPFLDILQNAGSVIIPGTMTDLTQEIAFSLLEDVYQITYTIDNAGGVTDVASLKNQSPQLLSIRTGFLLDGTLYLPMTVTTEITGIAFTLDETAGRYTVTLPQAQAT